MEYLLGWGVGWGLYLGGLWPKLGVGLINGGPLSGGLRYVKPHMASLPDEV